MTSIILPQFGAGIHIGQQCVWDRTFDGMLTTKWENDSFYIIVSVIGLSFFRMNALDYFNSDLRAKRRKELVPKTIWGQQPERKPYYML